ncbi:MAG: CrcB family protein [bacterium]|nr:CrcB family protein [bacterium]
MINAMAVFLGGGIGATVRYMLYLILPKTAYFPLCTMFANFLGCLIATIVFTYIVSKGQLNSTTQIFLITGFCGGLSTLSALSLEVLHYLQLGDYLRGCMYILTSLLICTISVILGVVLVKKYV